MTNEKAIDIFNQILESTEIRGTVAVTFAIPELIDALKLAIKSLEQIDVESVIDQLLQDIESTCTTYSVDGDTITTDVGYADEGIDFFVKHLKQRLKGKQDDG